MNVLLKETKDLWEKTGTIKIETRKIFFQPLMESKMKKGDILEKEGYEVIYQDTDSSFINSKVENYEQASKLGEELEKKINLEFDKSEHSNPPTDSWHPFAKT